MDTTMIPTNAPARAGLRSALRDFYEDYAYHLDSGDLSGWIEFFTEDAHYRVISRENFAASLPVGLIYCMNKDMIRDRVTALNETTMFEPRQLRHFVSGVRITRTEGDVLHAQANFLVTEALSDQEPTLNMVGLYLDQIVQTAEGFQIRSRDCVYDNYRIRNSLIIPV